MPDVMDSEDLTVIICTGFQIYLFIFLGGGSSFSSFQEFLFICSGTLVCILSYIFKSPVVVLSQCECDPGKETCRMSYICV